jgi:hypothetical protein
MIVCAISLSTTLTEFPMADQIKNYILSQPADRQKLLADIHSIILDKDKTIIPEVSPMMGKDMIIYKANGIMKYGLAGVKKYMSLHILPIYGSKALHAKYEALLHSANFQKGCINFESSQEMPLDIVKQLFEDCAKVDLAKIREAYLKEKIDRKKAGKA